MTGIIRTIGITLALLCAFLVPRADAGQLVSPADREWAKKAVAEEKSLSAPAGKNTVAVLYFRNGTGDPSLDPMRKGIPLLLITDLSGVPGLSVIERTRLQALTEETSLGASGLVEAGTAPRVGKLLGARWLVGGEIGREKPTRIDLASNVADVPAGTTTGKTSAGGEIEQLFEVEKELLFGVLKLLDVKVTPEEEQRLRKPCSKSVTALSALFLGVDAGDRGDLDKAEGVLPESAPGRPGRLHRLRRAEGDRVGPGLRPRRRETEPAAPQDASRRDLPHRFVDHEGAAAPGWKAAGHPRDEDVPDQHQPDVSLRVT